MFTKTQMIDRDKNHLNPEFRMKVNVLEEVV
jgi:hypothetical protein